MEDLAPTHVCRPGRRRATLALALACSAFAGGAHAGDPDVAITVTPLPATVTLRMGASTTQAAYRVDIVNRSTHVLNEVRFEASTRISPAVTPAGTRYVEDDSAQCGPAPGSQTLVACNFGKLRGRREPDANHASVVVVFEAPATGERLFLDWRATYKEGSKDNHGNSAPTNDSQSSAEPGKSVFATLAPPNDTQLSSFFAASTGALLFTSTGVPSGPPSDDRWTTTVRVPPGTAGEARIVEDSDPNSCSPVIPQCVRSAVSVPGTYTDKTLQDANTGFLVITLRRDASTIPYGAKIAKAPLLYEPGTIDADGVFQPRFPGDCAFPVRLKLCSEIGGAPSLPPPGTPPALAEQQKRCIRSFQVYPKTPGTPAGLQGDWEWVIWAIENGRISF